MYANEIVGINNKGHSRPKLFIIESDTGEDSIYIAQNIFATGNDRTWTMEAMLDIEDLARKNTGILFYNCMLNCHLQA